MNTREARTFFSVYFEGMAEASRGPGPFCGGCQWIPEQSRWTSMKAFDTSKGRGCDFFFFSDCSSKYCFRFPAMIVNETVNAFFLCTSMNNKKKKE